MKARDGTSRRKPTMEIKSSGLRESVESVVAEAASSGWFMGIV